MLFSKFSALAGALFASSALGTPFDLSRREVVVANQCTNLVYGATKVKFGQVCADIQDDRMKVVYTVDQGYTIKDGHVLVGMTKPTIDAFGQFPYTTDNGFCTIEGLKITCDFPYKEGWKQCDKDLYIVTHISVVSPSGGDETGFGDGTCYNNRGNCSKYWIIKLTCQCPYVYKYEDATTTKTYETEVLSTSTYTTSTVLTSTSTYEETYTVAFPDSTTTMSCPYPKKTTVITDTTKAIPEDWTPPAKPT